jgi:hypothetical protein
MNENLNNNLSLRIEQIKLREQNKLKIFARNYFENQNPEMNNSGISEKKLSTLHAALNMYLRAIKACRIRYEEKFSSSNPEIIMP